MDSKEALKRRRVRVTTCQLAKNPNSPTTQSSLSTSLLVSQKYAQLLSALIVFRRDTSVSAAAYEVRTLTTEKVFVGYGSLNGFSILIIGYTCLYLEWGRSGARCIL